MKKRVGILRGGKTGHYEKSLQKGGEIILYIHENLADKWKVIDILVDTDNLWHADGLPIRPAELINKVDVVWNTSHPNFSMILKSFGIPSVGVDAFPFFLGENRSILEEHMREIGVKMPRHFVIPAYQKDFDGSRDTRLDSRQARQEFILKKAKEVHEKFSPPWIIKSLTSNSNIPVHIANTYHELISAIEDIVNHNESILVEELIPGKEIFVHSISGFRGEEIYNFPIIENISLLEKEKLNKISKDIHKHLNISHYLNSHFIFHPKKGIFLKQIEFFPNFKKDSHFHESCKFIGAKAYHTIEHILEKALF